MSTWIRSMAVASALALAVTSALGDITGVSPGLGTLGTEIVVTGFGFGAKKPKVALEPHAGGGKPIKLKVTAASDTEITALLKKGVAGFYDLSVLVKGDPPAIFPGAFEVMPPVVTMVVPDTGAPGDEIEVSGDFFGLKRPKAMIGTARAKVLESTDTFIRLLVPKKLAGGVHDVVVMTKVGTGTLAAAFTSTAPPADLPKKDLFEVDLDGEHFEVKPGPTLVGTYDSVTHIMIIVATIQPKGLGGTLKQFTINTIADLNGALPTVVDEAPANPNEGFLSYQETDLPGSIGGVPVNRTWHSKDNTLEWSVTFTAFSTNRVVGTFSGIIRNVATNAPLNMVNGQFVVTLVVP